jgi:alpha-ketoglutarate-dependent taurine dioxygenase
MSGLVVNGLVVNGVTERPLYDDRSLLLIERHDGTCDLADIAGELAATWRAKLLEHGALLFRGFGISSVPAFERVVGAWSEDRLDYVYGSTPRHAVGNRLFTTTEYPPSEEIPLHNENSYQREWPLKVAFCCLQPASAGGETPIADMRCVGEAIGSELLDTFDSRGVRYIRHYHASVDVPWQQVFKTDDPAVLVEVCARHGLEHEWLDAQTLRTKQVCQGTAVHPETRERVFFNQAHLFHASSVGADVARSMTELFGADRLPRQSYFGDGGEIPAEWLARIRAAYSDSSFVFQWQPGDVLLLDNMRYAHGRRPFKGTRRIIAALMDRHRTNNQEGEPTDSRAPSA